MAIDRYSYPFTAIVGQEQMKLALVLNAIDPAIGGVLIRGEKGTGKSTAVRALAKLLPEQQIVEGCHFGCHPDDPEDFCMDCRERARAGALPVTTRRMRVVELPINASEDRVVGTIDLEAALKEGSRRFEPGVLAEANRNILYVDEVNLLDDHIGDVLLDAAAMGINTVEREGVSVSHPSRFILVGTMNPEEGELRPQLLDRFGLCVDVEGIRDLDQRVAIVEKRAAWEDDPNLFYQQHAESEQSVRSQIAEAIATFPEVNLPREILRLIAQISIALEVDGHRSDLVCARAAQAKAAYDSAEKVGVSHVGDVADVAHPDFLSAVIGRLGLRRARANEVGAMTVNLQRDRDLRDQAQDLARQLDLGKRRDGLCDLRANALLRLGVLLVEEIGIVLPHGALLDDLDTLVEVADALHVDAQPKAVQQLRPELTLLGVHRADEDEARRMRN